MRANFSIKIWPYQNFALHFCLGTLLNVYSLFYIKSASLFSSVVFLFLMIVMIFMNELPFVKRSEKINLKVGLYSICLFSFFSIVYPLIFGFIGLVPFSFSVASTLAILIIQLCFKVLNLCGWIVYLKSNSLKQLNRLITFAI